MAKWDNKHCQNGHSLVNGADVDATVVEFVYNVLFISESKSTIQFYFQFKVTFFSSTDRYAMLGYWVLIRKDEQIIGIVSRAERKIILTWYLKAHFDQLLI